ncbi:FtsX-like permease family protein [Streptococcus equi]|uniref:FtsX-like permease family protein n=1 Tax=Streptococcus equi TaxID=1336 RepID=UPI001E4A7FCD|nr:FtsX-like permease family protein [Streptococcus equi]
MVAALVTFTTMARYVDEERTNSGLLKAIGYSDWDITKKFLLYGALAALLGMD